jgi:hypothetical protein
VCGVSLQVRGHPEIGSGERSVYVRHLAQECVTGFKHELQPAVPVATEIELVRHHAVNITSTEMSVQ